MVVIDLPSAAETGKVQDRAGLPSTSTVQAPHWAMPQPYLVPVKPISLRIAQSKGISGSISRLYALPLIWSFAIARFLKWQDEAAIYSLPAFPSRCRPAN